eukprot:TRINITY_DN78582_c0_g1_i1.p1 TRINITY_DN78582_c0_g1~~TRINITY_DN78582_c0_g1_i1.p1  ORF type:complete len:138 (-),score=33.16 TRINITY_DN78582_c0_g1_i1:92-505(-)
MPSSPQSAGKGSKGGRGGGKGAPSTPSKGAGRGLPDFKDNSGGRLPGQDAESNGEGTGMGKFNTNEVSEWIAGRYQAVMADYDKQKQSGVLKGEIQNYSDMNSERSAWGAKPVIPPKEDFLYQLQAALMQFQGRQRD